MRSDTAAPQAPGVLRRLARVPLADWLDLLPAHWYLLRAQIALWAAPRGRLLDMPTTDADPALLPLAQRLGRAASRVRRFGLVRPKCLAFSLGLARWLAARGARGARVTIGVSSGSGGFFAHAWVVYAGTVVGDDPRYVARFAVLATPRTDLPLR